MTPTRLMVTDALLVTPISTEKLFPSRQAASNSLLLPERSTNPLDLWKEHGDHLRIVTENFHDNTVGGFLAGALA